MVDRNLARADAQHLIKTHDQDIEQILFEKPIFKKPQQKEPPKTDLKKIELTKSAKSEDEFDPPQRGGMNENQREEPIPEP